MPEDNEDDLAARIERARAIHKPDTKIQSKQTASAVSASGLALRHGTEMAACVLVSIVLGLTIDNFLGTAPWGFLIMLGFGLAAGVFGVIRAYQQINADLAKTVEDGPDKRTEG